VPIYKEIPSGIERRHFNNVSSVSLQKVSEFDSLPHQNYYKMENPRDQPDLESFRKSNRVADKINKSPVKNGLVLRYRDQLLPKSQVSSGMLQTAKPKKNKSGVVSRSKSSKSRSRSRSKTP